MSRRFGLFPDPGVPIYLASKSPRRSELLARMGLEFTVREAAVDEDLDNSIDPPELTQMLAGRKAGWVAERIDCGIVIGADTVVVLDGRILGKPRSTAEASEMLRSLSGRVHQVYTGYALHHVPSDKSHTDVQLTKVRFRELQEEEIAAYIELNPPMDKAGAYGIQDSAALFVDWIEGCYYNIVGFPLGKFYQNWCSFIQTL